MKKTWLIVLFICLSAILFANETQSSEGKSAEGEKFFATNQRGDQFLRLAITMQFPALPKKLFPIGGSGTIGYSYFITSGFLVGGEVSFSFNATEGSNLLYVIPIMAKGGYQWTVGRFEIPLMLAVGGAFETYISRLYFGLAVKPEVGGFFRITPDWSAGLLASVWILPQWYKNTDYNRVGIFPDVSISARYHF